MNRSTPALIAAFVVSVAAPALADDLGGPGESCRARSDCRQGLKCVAQVCVDEHEGLSCQARSDCGELRCVRNRCVAPNPTSTSQQSAPAPKVEAPKVEAPQVEAPPASWSEFRLEGAHGFVGVTFQGGASALAVANDVAYVWATNPVQPSFLFALRGGLMIGRNEIAAEVSPMTYAYYPNMGGPTFQFNVSYGHYLPLYEGTHAGVYWPIRLGVGAMTGNTDGSVFFQSRADLVGTALRVGHLMFDFTVSSFRYSVTSSSYYGTYAHGTASIHHFAWESGLSVSYVF